MKNDFLEEKQSSSKQRQWMLGLTATKFFGSLNQTGSRCDKHEGADAFPAGAGGLDPLGFPSRLGGAAAALQQRPKA
jgi:hypothetical protein